MNLDASREFLKFLKNVIEPSITDIAKLEEKSRKHVQKLVYTNMVDRFDGTIDRLFLDNVRHPNLLPEALKDANETITQKDLFELLLQSTNLDEILNEKLREGISNTITRNNHAQKLSTLFRLCAGNASAHGNTPRVNPATGAIIDKIKPQKKATQPYTIVGYADWLYARRNAIVHGTGTSLFLTRDADRIQKMHRVKIAKSFKISLGSIGIAKAFYSEVIDLFENNHDLTS